MISICYPTRGRPEIFKRSCLSILDSASNPNDIEFITYHDSDDASIYEYLGNHKEVVGDRIIQSAMYNECYKLAAGPIYMFAADDAIFHTKGWDMKVLEAFDTTPDKIMFVHPDERGHNFGSRFGTVGFLHKNWIDTVGYFLPPYFEAELVDNWINDIAINISRKYFLRDMIIELLPIDDDITHVEYMKKGRETNAQAIYRLKTEERMRDTRKLEAFIRDFKHKPA